jgi:myosin-crossreactive antigen
MNRFLYLFGHLSDMTGVMRTPINQHQAFIEPLVAWLRPRGVNFLTGAFVQDIDFAICARDFTTANVVGLDLMSFKSLIERRQPIKRTVFFV